MAGAAEGFASSTEHLLAEVARVDLLLAAHALGAAAGPERPVPSTEERIHVLLDRAAAAAPPPSPAVIAARAAADRMAAAIEARRAESVRRGTPLRLARLAERFGLERADVDLLLVAICPELPEGAALSEGAAALPCTVGVAVAALFPSVEARIAACRRLSPGAPLVRHGLVHVGGEPGAPHRPLPARILEVDPRVLAFLLGDDATDARLAPHVRLSASREALADLLLPAPLKHGLLRVVMDAVPDRPPPIVSLIGPHGTGRRAVVEAACAAAGRALVVVDCAALLAAGEDAFVRAASLAAREARILDAALLWASGGDAFAPERPAARVAWLTAARAAPVLTFITGRAPWDPGDALGDRPFVQVELPPPNASEQANIWAAALAEQRGDDVDLAALTSMYRLTGGQIQEAAAAARTLARFRDLTAGASPSNGDGAPGLEARVSMADIQSACRGRHSRRMSALGQPIAARHGWDDLVLPADRKAMLREICLHLRHRSRVFDDWGMARKLTHGRSLSALFSGPPGTGKTMAAGVIARELGVPMFRIDLSTVVSKYIGETEKHLSELFAEAEAANAALFFDEADALFAKRTEVRDAHDRYANMETSHLLQRIEAFEGVVLLATNFLKNLDEAFLRRLAFVVEFPFPSAADRLRIWHRIWALETPRDPELDLDLLAERVELSGGYIRNIALAAAFLAAEDGTPIAMRHLLHATRREFQKMGKVVDFGALAHGS